MAAWQFGFYLEPAADVGAISSEDASWVGHQDQAAAMVRELDARLPRGHHWSPGQELWGDLEHTAIEFWRDERGRFEFCEVRLDVRDIGSDAVLRVIDAVLAAARTANAAIVHGGNVIPCERDKLMEVIASSRAARFVSDPQGAVERTKFS